jgi:GTP-binding protein Era
MCILGLSSPLLEQNTLMRILGLFPYLRIFMDQQSHSDTPVHKSGFVSIIGKPNVGKSTLMNALIGEKISIISPKVQTTRHRIMGILSKPGYQIVFSDTPGIINPKYKLHGNMMQFVNESLQDADVVLFITSPDQDSKSDLDLIERLKMIKTPLVVIINKVDLLTDTQAVANEIEAWQSLLDCKHIIAVSAQNQFMMQELVGLILPYLPTMPSFYPADQLTDKSERFIASEIIREKIIMRYKEEIPYAVQVEVTSFKDEEKILKIDAEIYVMRDSQRQILIGKGGIAIKNVGIAARRDLEKFFGKKIFLQTYVRVKENWRDSDTLLKQFGYKTE